MSQLRCATSILNRYVSREKFYMSKENIPRAFISYSWDSDEHKEWVNKLSARLRSDGIDVTLDQWHLVPGDQLPKFMEKEIRENEYVIIICTPAYKLKSDQRQGGVGYEGDIITGEVFQKQNHRKFIPVLAQGNSKSALPTWMVGKYYLDLSSPERFEQGYSDLITTIHGKRPVAPPIGQGKKETTLHITSFDTNSLKAEVEKSSTPIKLSLIHI